MNEWVNVYLLFFSVRMATTEKPDYAEALSDAFLMSNLFKG